MAKLSLARARQVVAGSFASGAHVVVGTLVALTDDGTVHVDFPGNDLGALPARLVGPAASEPLAATPVGTALALAFENGDTRRPLVLGVVADRRTAGVPGVMPGNEAHRDVRIDGRQLVFTAEQEVVIRCGSASIHLCRDGKLVIKGTEVVSRASRANKIKGGVVNIN